MMKAVQLRLFHTFCVLVTLVLTVSNTFAHVGADNMPDSVAEVEYSIYLEFKPNDLQVRNKLGMVYFRMKKMAEAEREFSKILKKEPDNYDALDGMGLVKAEQNKFEEAIQLHQRSIALNPKDMMVYFHLGSALEKESRFREAKEAYSIALEKFKEQYPSGTDNKNATEFQKKLMDAISKLKNKQ